MEGLLSREDFLIELNVLTLPHAPKIYLACPYSVRGSGHNKAWEILRFECANIAAMRLINLGLKVFSPISHSHPISLTQPHDELNTHDLWLGQDKAFYEDWANLLVILTLPGWYVSHGVTVERRSFLFRDVPEFLLSMEQVYELEKGEKA